MVRQDIHSRRNFALVETLRGHRKGLSVDVSPRDIFRNTNATLREENKFHLSTKFNLKYHSPNKTLGVEFTGQALKKLKENLGESSGGRERGFIKANGSLRR